MKSYLVATVVCIFCMPPFVQAQQDVEQGEDGEKSEGVEQSGGVEDAAMKAQNPLADIISMPLQWNTDFDIGPDDETGSTLNIQPIYPVKLSEKWTLINRAILPLPKSVPAGGHPSGRETGMGDITMMNWFSPAPKGAFMWGVALRWGQTTTT